MQKALVTPANDTEAIVDLVLDGLTSDHSRRAYGRALRCFLTWYETEGRKRLTKAAVQAYKVHLQAQGLAAGSVNIALSAIRKLAREAADNGLLDEDTAAAIGRVPNLCSETIPAGRDISPGELAGLMLACAHDYLPAGWRDAALIAVLYITGARRSELVALDLDDYDRETGALTIRKGKGGRQRLVYALNGAGEALDDWLALRGPEPGPIFCPINRGGRITVRRMTGQAVRRILDKRRRQAGVEPLTPHDFRRTAVGDLLDAGADLVTVQRILGHASPVTTSRYDRRPESAKRKAAGLLHVPYFRRQELPSLGLGKL